MSALLAAGGRCHKTSVRVRRGRSVQINGGKMRLGDPASTRGQFDSSWNWKLPKRSPRSSCALASQALRPCLRAGLRGQKSCSMSQPRWIGSLVMGDCPGHLSAASGRGHLGAPHLVHLASRCAANSSPTPADTAHALAASRRSSIIKRTPMTSTCRLLCAAAQIGAPPTRATAPWQQGTDQQDGQKTTRATFRFGRGFDATVQLAPIQRRGQRQIEPVIFRPALRANDTM